MSLSGIKTRPFLRGTVVASGPWQALFARSGLRVYPFQLGCMVRTNTSTSSVPTHGMGEFAVNNYFIACTSTSYGSGHLWIPDLTRISRVTAVSASDDVLTVSPALTLVAGEYLLNIGNDGAAAPTTAPNYDGSTITLYTDNAGNTANANDYLTTATGGWYQGWTGTGIYAVDLLITDSSGAPMAINPMVALGPEIV